MTRSQKVKTLRNGEAKHALLASQEDDYCLKFMNYLFIRYYYSMLIIKNDNSGKDLNDFWLESKITNCCNVVKHKQSSNKIKAININELYNEYYDTYTNQSEKLKK